MGIRATIFFQFGITGWSETYYSVFTSLDSALARVERLTDLRVNLMPETVQITYQRVSDDAVFRDAFVDALAKNGTFPDADGSDAAFVSLLVRLSSGNQTKRSLFLRGIPDTLIVNGLFQPSATWLNAWRAFSNELKSAWAISGYNPLVSPASVLFITDAGGVTTLGAHGLSVGQTCRFRNVRCEPTTSGKTFIVTTVINPTAFTVAGWAPRPAIQQAKAQVFPNFKVLLNIDSARYERIVSRRVGRPFGLSLGRRRRTA
jgi:hypothetical protein